ncbi:MAG TPA: hypothetical protein VHV77_16545, partial [Pirellulales bacterium]|nr:hypothetical protein [Pirellulales bacterium]
MRIVITRAPFLIASAIGLLLVLGPTHVQAAPGPTVRTANVRGLTSGATTKLVVDGTSLGPNPKVLLSVPIAAQEATSVSPKRDRAEFDITLPADAPPGIHQLWVVTDEGISNPLEMGVDGLPEMPWGEKLEKLPVALNAVMNARDVLRTSFSGKVGDKVVIDIEARRIGSNLNPVVHLYDPRGVQLAWSQSHDSIFGDARIDVQLAADGEYTVELHDALFNARGQFRLKIGALEYADLAFPLAAKIDQAVPLGFVSSNFPTGTAVVATGKHAGAMPAPWPGLANLTGARPRVLVTEYDETVEQSASGSPQQLHLPSGVSGRLAQAGEVDRYELIVAPKTRVRLDVTANRVGSPLDGVLTARTTAGVEIATNDDQPMTPDPGMQFNVPSDAKSVIVSLADRTGRGGSDFVYYLSATQVGQPDFSLSVMGPSVSVPGSGVTVAHVRATRTGYNGPIRLSLDPMPAGVTLTGTEIPSGATDTLLAFHVGKESPSSALATLAGEAVDLKPPLRRVAQTPNRAVATVQPWLRDQLPLAITEPSTLQIAWEPASGQSALPLGSVLPISLRLDRDKSAKGPVRVSLLTSQVMPTKRIPQVDKKKKPLPDKIVDDLDRAVRLKLDKDETSLMLAADASEAKAEIIVPGDLANIPYDVTLKAELLAADGKRVVAEAYAPVSRLRTTFPFTVELTGPAKVKAQAGVGDTGSLEGKIVRTSAFEGPVTVTLRNLPAEFAVPNVLVPANKDTFSLPIAFPYHTAKGEVKGVQVAAEGKGAFGPIQSNLVPVALAVVAGAAPEGPLRIFEDEAIFAAN